MVNVIRKQKVMENHSIKSTPSFPDREHLWHKLRWSGFLLEIKEFGQITAYADSLHKWNEARDPLCDFARENQTI